MIEIKTLSHFLGNLQSSDQKPDFWNSFTKQTSVSYCIMCHFSLVIGLHHQLFIILGILSFYVIEPIGKYYLPIQVVQYIVSSRCWKPLWYVLKKTTFILLLNHYQSNKIMDEFLLQSHNGLPHSSGKSGVKETWVGIMLTGNVHKTNRYQGLMYLQLLCCWFWKRKPLFLPILSNLIYITLLLFSIIMLKLKKNGILFCQNFLCISFNCSALFHYFTKSNKTLSSCKLFYSYLQLWEG